MTGPGANTLDEPGNAPWVIGVANASHNRRFVNSSAVFPARRMRRRTLAGQGYTSGYGPATIVYAGNYGNALCGIGDTEGVTPTGASNPFAAGTFHGEIVICDRGIYARVEKGYNVKAAGAGGYILANAASDGESIISDDHFLPAVHLGYSEGQQLKRGWPSPARTAARLPASARCSNDSYGDILDASSSRGPYGFGGGVLEARPHRAGRQHSVGGADRQRSGVAQRHVDGQSARRRFGRARDRGASGLVAGTGRVGADRHGARQQRAHAGWRDARVAARRRRRTRRSPRSRRRPVCICR